MKNEIFLVTENRNGASVNQGGLNFYDEIIYDFPIALSTSGLADRLSLNLENLQDRNIIPQGSILPWGFLFLCAIQNLKANATRVLDDTGFVKVKWNPYYLLGDTREERFEREKEILEENFSVIRYLFDKLDIEQKGVVAEIFVEQLCSELYENELNNQLLENKGKQVFKDNQIMHSKKLAMQFNFLSLQIRDSHKLERDIGFSNRYIYKIMEMFNNEGLLNFLSVPSPKNVVSDSGLVMTFAALREIRELLKTFESGDKFKSLFEEVSDLRNDFWKMFKEGIQGNCSNDLRVGLIVNHNKTYTNFYSALTCYINSLIDDSYREKGLHIKQLSESIETLENYVFDELNSPWTPINIPMVKDVLGVLYDLSLSDELSNFLKNNGGKEISLSRSGIFENLLLVDFNENDECFEQEIVEKVGNSFENPSSMIINFEVLLKMDRINDYDTKKSFVEIIDGNYFKKQAFMMAPLSADIGNYLEVYRKSFLDLSIELKKELNDMNKVIELEKIMESSINKLVNSKFLFFVRKNSINLISQFCKENNTPLIMEVGRYKNNVGCHFFGMKVTVNDMPIDFLKYMLKTFLFDYDKPIYEMEIERNDFVMRQDLVNITIEDAKSDKEVHKLAFKNRKF